MADIDWAVWLKEALAAHAPLAAIVPAESHHAAGSLDKSPKERPFLVIMPGQEVRGPFPGRSVQYASVWVHDEPGSYYRIGQALGAVRDALCGVGASQGKATLTGGVCRWISNSQPQVDEGFKTLSRTAEFQLYGGDGNAEG